MRMLFVLRSALSEREVGAIMPYLRGVVPTAELLDIWDGFFSNDTAGIIRTINRMPDDEALAMVAEYAKAGRLAGSSAGALLSTVTGILGESEENYRALLALADRFGRLADSSGGEAAPDAPNAAQQLASQIRIKAAFLRIKEADRRGDSPTAYLAVAGLTTDERRTLDNDYVKLLARSIPQRRGPAPAEGDAQLRQRRRRHHQRPPVVQPR